MTCSSGSVQGLVDAQMAIIEDRARREALAQLLVPPRLEEREWDYGAPDTRYPYWVVAEAPEFVTLGMDCQWGWCLEEAFIRSGLWGGATRRDDAFFLSPEQRFTWGEGPNVLSATVLDTLERALTETPVIVEHRFYRGSGAPNRRIFDDFEELKAYLSGATVPGDAIWVWRYDQACRDDNAVAAGKIPDVRGHVPRGGAY